MNFPVFTQLAGNFRFSETGSLETASSSGESVANSIWAKVTLPMRLPPRLLGALLAGGHVRSLAAIPQGVKLGTSPRVSLWLATRPDRRNIIATGDLRRWRDTKLAAARNQWLESVPLQSSSAESEKNAMPVERRGPGLKTYPTPGPGRFEGEGDVIVSAQTLRVRTPGRLPRGVAMHRP